MQTEYDVLIAGSGLAGGCLALALQTTGLKVGVIEAVPEAERHASSTGDRALALSKGTMCVLDQLGVWASVAEKAAPIRQIHISDQGHFGKTRLSAEKAGVDALGYVIIARDIEQQVGATLAKASTHLICPARVMAVTTGPDKVAVSVKYKDESHVLTARVLVAADGGNSTVRKLLDIGQQQRDYGQTAIVTTVKPELPHNFTAYERFAAEGPLAMLPLTDEHCAVIWTLSTQQAEEAMTLPEADFMQQLQQLFGQRLGNLQLIAPRRSFPLSLVRAEQMVSGRVVLIGNAAHQLHPVAGQGFNLGLRDVTALAETLIEANQQGDDVGAASALKAYQQARQRDHNTVIGFTDTVVRLFSNDWWPLAAGRNAGLIALDHIPGGKQYLTQYAMGLAGRRPRLQVNESEVKHGH